MARTARMGRRYSGPSHRSLLLATLPLTELLPLQGHRFRGLQPLHLATLNTAGVGVAALGNTQGPTLSSVPLPTDLLEW